MGDADIAGWLDKHGFRQYLDQVEAWCEDNDARFVQELKQEWEDVADHIGLAGADRERFARACGGVFGPPDAPYVLLEELGKGATAKVHRCTRGGREFAAKVIDLKRLTSFRRDADKVISKLDREISIMRTLRHKRLVCLHDVVEEKTDMLEHRLYLVMELIRGGELIERIIAQPAGCLPEAESRHVFKQLIEAISYIHSKNVVHRDLKAENVLIDSTPSMPDHPQIKLLDFGHSKLIRDGYNRAESRVGTPVYWAPEVPDSGSASYDEKADLWSLGVLLYFMLVGAYPFGGGDARKDSFKFPGGNRRTAELVRGLIRVQPEDRMTLDQCLECDWIVEGMSAPACAALGQPEVRVRLPQPPRDLENFNAKLIAWSRRWQVAARLDILNVVVTLHSDADVASVRETREDLERLLSQDLLEIKENKALGSALDPEAARKRADELAELEREYGCDLEVRADNEWRIRLRRDDFIRVILPDGYPLTEAPVPCVECASGLKPWFSEDSLLWTPGHPCVSDWVETMKEDALVDPKPASKRLL